MTDTYFIGYDAREDEAANVAAFSIRRWSTTRTRIYKLEHRLLRTMGLFTRPWRIEPNGQFYDMRDGRPFSTEFSHSRFLVFHLAHALRLTGPCMFIDCDWLFMADPAEVMDKQRKEPGRIGVVNRHREVAEDSVKMDGMVQQNYHRKLWSAMFTFTPGAGWEETFNVNAVNAATGRDLHAFFGIRDEDFWQIPPEWHFIPSLDQYPENGLVKGIHYSEFSPWLNPDKRAEYTASFTSWEAARDATRGAIYRRGGPEFLWNDLKLDFEAITA